MPDRLVLLDGSLVDRSGHAYEYDRNVLEAFAEAGWETVAYVNRDCSIDSLAGIPTRKLLTLTPTDKIIALRALRPVAKMIVHWSRSGAELRRAIAETDGDRVVFFVQHAEGYHLPALLRAFRGSRGRLMLMLRGTSLNAQGAPTFRTRLYGFFLPRLVKLLGNRLLLVTDAARLAQEYRPLVRHPIHIVPIPNPPASPRHRRARQGPPRVLIAGRMSFEKGIHFVPALVVRARSLALPLEFHVHAYSHPDERGIYDEILAKLEALAGKDLVLAREPLSTAAYWQATAAADVSLMLYDTGRYRNQTSNVLLDALACGVYPIVSEGTWLADTVRQAGFGAMVEMSDPVRIVERTLSILGLPRPAAVPSSVDALLAYHSAASFRTVVTSILDGEAAESVERPR